MATANSNCVTSDPRYISDDIATSSNPSGAEAIIQEAEAVLGQIVVQDVPIDATDIKNEDSSQSAEDSDGTAGLETPTFCVIRAALDSEDKSASSKIEFLQKKHSQEIEGLEDEIRELERKYACLQQDYQNTLEERDNLKASAVPQAVPVRGFKSMLDFARSTNSTRRIRLHGDTLFRASKNEIRSRANAAALLYILFSQPHFFFFAFCAVYGCMEHQYVDLALLIILVGQSAVIQYLVHPHWRRKRSPNPEFVDKLTENGIMVKEDVRHLFEGAMIMVEQGQKLPADCLLLRAYGDRIQLDVSESHGYSKLSEKLPVEETKTCGPAELAALQGALVVDAPNASMTFSGTFRREGLPRRTRLTMENLALTGSVLVAPTAAYFVVVYAGADTKAALNTKYHRPKSISTQILQQAYVILIFISVAFALITTSAEELQTNRQGLAMWFADFFYALYCCRHICPIGLFISVDFARVAQGSGSAIYAYGDLGRVSTVVVGSGLLTRNAETLTMSLVGDRKYGFLTFEDLEPCFDKSELESLELRLMATSQGSSCRKHMVSREVMRDSSPSYFSRPIFQSPRAQGLVVDRLLEKGSLTWTNECLVERSTGKRVLAAGWRQSALLARLLEGSVHPRLLTFSMQRKDRVAQILESIPDYLINGVLADVGGGSRRQFPAPPAGAEGQAYTGALKKSRTQVLRRSRTAIIKKLGTDTRNGTSNNRGNALGTADPYFLQLRPLGMFDIERVYQFLATDVKGRQTCLWPWMETPHVRVFSEDFVDDLCGAGKCVPPNISNAEYCFAMLKANICCLVEVQLSNSTESFRKFTVSTITSSSDHAVISALSRYGVAISQWTNRRVVCHVNPAVYNNRYLPPKDGDGNVSWEILGVNQLNERQRRSVVIHDVDGYVLLCKGSVSALMPRIQRKSDVEHLRRMYRLFAREGCRTEMVARRYLDNDEAQQYKEQLEAAESALIDTRHETNELFEKMEANLECIGMNAFEDVLVPGAENTLQAMLDGGLRVWILSGDAADRMLRIAQQIKLLPTDATLFSVLSGPQGSQSEVHARHAFKQTYTQFSGALSDLCKNKKMGSCALVFDGPSLAMVLKDPQLTAMFIHMALMVESCVLGCQLTPAQKAEVCTLVREKSECSILPGIGLGGAASSPFLLGVGNSMHEKEMIKATNVSVELGSRLDAGFQISSFQMLEQLIFHQGRLHFRTLAFLVRFYLCVASSIVGALVIRQSGFVYYPELWMWFPCMHLIVVGSICVLHPSDVERLLPILFPALHIGNMGNVLFSYDMTIENCVVGFAAGILAQVSCQQTASFLQVTSDHCTLMNLHIFAMLVLLPDVPRKALPLLIWLVHLPVGALPSLGEIQPIAISTLFFLLWACLAVVLRLTLAHRHFLPEWRVVSWWSRTYPVVVQWLSEIVESRLKSTSEDILPAVSKMLSTKCIEDIENVSVPLIFRYRQGLKMKDCAINADMLNPIGPERTYATDMPSALSVVFTTYAMGHIVQLAYVVGQAFLWVVWLSVLAPTISVMHVPVVAAPLLSLPCWLLPDGVVDKVPSLFTFAVAITWTVPLTILSFLELPRKVVASLALFATFATPFVLRLMPPLHAIVALAVGVLAFYDEAYSYASAVWIVLLETSFTAYVLLRHMRGRFLSIKIAGEEAERTKKSLHNMLPSHVVEGLVIKGKTFQDFTAAKPDVAVLFCKIDDFARWVQYCKPVELVTALDRLFAGFDSSCESRKASKVESASEVYFAVAGTENVVLQPEESVNCMLDVALDLLYISTKIHLYMRGENLDGEKLPGETLEGDSNKSRTGGRRTFLLKIGINIGEVICGVVGSKKPQYSLYGDTVNTAARMAQMCDPDGNVQVTEEAQAAVRTNPIYTWRETFVQAKGKGRVRCFLLESAKGIELIAQRAPPVRSNVRPASFAGARRCTLSAVPTVVEQKRRLSFTQLQQDLAETLPRKSPVPSDSSRQCEYKTPQSALSLVIETSPTRALPGMKMEKFSPPQSAGSAELTSVQGKQMLVPPRDNLRCRRPSIKLNVDDVADEKFAGASGMSITFEAIRGEGTPSADAYEELDGTDSQPDITYPTLKFTDSAQELKFCNAMLLETRNVTLSLVVTTIGFMLLSAHSFLAQSRFLKHYILLSSSAMLFIATYFQRWLPKSEIVPDFLLVLVVAFGSSAALERDYPIVAAWAGLLICNRAVLMTSQCIALASLESVTLATMIYDFAEDDHPPVICSVGILFCLWYSAWLTEWWARTSFIEHERVRELGLRATQLLDEMMPQEILRQLKDESAASVTTTRIAYDYNHCVLLFSDICGFTAYSSKTSPDKVVEMLSALFVYYDRLTTELELYKLCTIGDAYVCLTEPKVKNTEAVAALEAERVIWMAEMMHRHLRSVAEALSIAYLNMRIGLHIGHLLGGVLGRTKLRFDVFGETVLIASHMEQAGEPGQINVSSHLKRFLEKHFPEDRFRFHFNKEISIMGKRIESYHLTDLKSE